MDDLMVQDIINETNAYAGQLKNNNPRTLKKWSPIDESMFWKFMGLSTMMGVVKKSDIKEYWSKFELFSTPAFGRIISRDR